MDFPDHHVCTEIDAHCHTCQTCRNDIYNLFVMDSKDGKLCVRNEISETYAFEQAFTITVYFVAIILLIGKICAIRLDNRTENRLVVYIHIAFFFYALAVIWQ